MDKNKEIEYRNVFEAQVKEMMLGPGYAKEIICCKDDASDEIIDNDPTRLYCTGVMVPKGISNSEVEDTSVEEQSSSDEDNIVLDGDDDQADDYEMKGGDYNQEQEDRTFFSSDHIGIITCVSSDTKEISIDVKYAKYKKVDDISIVKIHAGHNYENFKTIINANDNNNNVEVELNINGFQESFSNYFLYDDEKKTVALKTKLPNTLIPILNRIQASDAEWGAQELLKKLLKGNFYQRIPRSGSKIVPIEDSACNLNDDLECLLKSFSHKGKQYLKVIVRNRLAANEDGYYKYCLYQPILRITPQDGSLVTYTDPISMDDDEENNINEFCYREVINYGKGIGCAVSWAEDGKWIETTYMPRREVRKFSNSIDQYYLEDKLGNGRERAEAIEKICTLRNISIWTEMNDDELLEGLTKFVDGYEAWHQSEQGTSVEDKYNQEKAIIIERQTQLHERLRDNIQFMQENPEALNCFKIANAAMLIQMVVARDKNFDKNRDIFEADNAIFDSLDYFSGRKYNSYLPEDKREPQYRPFQLAFLLMNVKSTMVEDDPYRTKFVDLIWFPTGGGKTEAYLALTALTIVARRRNSADIISGYEGEPRGNNYTTGVSVIMRYTLRLLTAQQFERASFLICALDFLRQKEPELNLGTNRISIGLWIGQSSSPNKLNDLRDRRGKYQEFLNSTEANAVNPFPIAYCPWCGKKLKETNNNHGYTNQGLLECLNDSCHFRTDTKLPIYYIDEVIYRQRPTLLFATVDKFAQIYTDDASKLFRANDTKSPDLIIQDELHLISGPLGSTVALFESTIEEMASQAGHRPKIIASTATTRNTGKLIKSLYGKNREVNVFPAQGLSYKDNYFSHLEGDALRCHIGIMPTGWTTSNDTEIRLTATLLLSRIKLAMKLLADNNVNPEDFNLIIKTLLNNDKKFIEDLDIFWSIVLYYNSLKDLGRSYSRVSQEVYENLRAKRPYFQIPDNLNFMLEGFYNRTKEFTSREDSSHIKTLLTDAETCVSVEHNGEDSIRIGSRTIDLVFASNMISVGIDIARWNLMVMMGQPRSTSEYIQSSSRVARSHQGVVYNLINPNRIREFSLFENYTSFHEAYYKYVEPLSATPLNSQMMKLPLWVNIWKCFKEKIVSSNLTDEQIIDVIINCFKMRFDMNSTMEKEIRDRLNEISENGGDTMTSLRDIDPNCYMMIKNISY